MGPRSRRASGRSLSARRRSTPQLTYRWSSACMAICLQRRRLYAAHLQMVLCLHGHLPAEASFATPRSGPLDVTLCARSGDRLSAASSWSSSASARMGILCQHTPRARRDAGSTRQQHHHSYTHSYTPAHTPAHMPAPGDSDSQRGSGFRFRVRLIVSAVDPDGNRYRQMSLIDIDCKVIVN